METKMKKEPEEGPNGVDRWSSNGYGLTIDGIEVKNEEADHGKETQERASDER